MRKTKNGTKKNKMMESLSKIRVYTNGLVKDGVGAYAYIVLESRGGEMEIAGEKVTAFSPSILRAKFAMAGLCDDDMRMKMRAAYEGVRHCPNGTAVEIYTDNFLAGTCLETTKPTDEDGDIAERYRKYLATSGITVKFRTTKVYNGKELPGNDHDEWTWWAYHLCEDAIKRYNKENNRRGRRVDIEQMESLWKNG